MPPAARSALRPSRPHPAQEPNLTHLPSPFSRSSAAKIAVHAKLETKYTSPAVIANCTSLTAALPSAAQRALSAEGRMAGSPALEGTRPKSSPRHCPRDKPTLGILRSSVPPSPQSGKRQDNRSRELRLPKLSRRYRTKRTTKNQDHFLRRRTPRTGGQLAHAAAPPRVRQRLSDLNARATTRTSPPVSSQP